MSSRTLRYLIVIIVICVTLAGLLFTIRHYTAKEIALREIEGAAAKEIAEYGLEQALINLTKDPYWNAGFKNEPYKTGFYDVTIAVVADSEYQVVAAGTVGKMRKEIPCKYYISSIDGVVKARGLKCE